MVGAASRPLPEVISLEELRNLSFVFRERGSGTYHIIRKTLEKRGIAIHQLQEKLILGSTEGIKQFLQHSACFALLSVYSIRKELAEGTLRIVDIADFAIERTFYAIHRQGEIDPYARKFLDFVVRFN